MNLIETIERKRQEYRKKVDQRDLGTLVGLREMMKKQQIRALEQPKKELSNAK